MAFLTRPSIPQVQARCLPPKMTQAGVYIVFANPLPNAGLPYTFEPGYAPANEACTQACW